MQAGCAVLNTALPCPVCVAGWMLETRAKWTGAWTGLPAMPRVLDETQESSCGEKGRKLPCAFCAKKGECDGHSSCLDALLCWRRK